MAVRPQIVKPGTWGMSLIVRETAFDGSFDFMVAAHRQLGRARRIAAHYPPMMADGSGYAAPFALVWIEDPQMGFDADTRLLPPLALDQPVSGLSVADRAVLAAILDSCLPAYEFVDYDQARRSKLIFRSSRYDADATPRQIIADIYEHLHHSEFRPRAAQIESHNTEFLDDFATDPFAGGRFTNERGTAVYDGTNLEVDMDTSIARNAVRRSDVDTGSIEHEAQATCIGTGSINLPGGGAVRFRSDGTDDWYFLNTDSSVDDTYFHRVAAGAGTLLQTNTDALIHASGDWLSMRLAAAGAVGANVVLSSWYTNHGTIKPSDPGWVGVDASPNNTFTDTSVDRHDDADDIDCGMACGGSGVDYDTRHDFFKMRAISDRSGEIPVGQIIW